MARKTHSTGTAADDNRGEPPLSETVKESASQIWLAGLGAFAKAQEGGTKVFDTLVKEGLSIQRKTQAAAEEKIAEAASRMASMATMATGISSRASGQWDRLETIFEERVARALNRLGVPSSKDIHALMARIDELERSVARLSAGSGAKARAARPARPAGAAKPAAKPARKSGTRAARKTA